MSGLYDALAVPFGYVLHLFYNLFDNYLISLFVLTLLVKLLLLPSSISQQKNSAKQTRLQPKLNRIRQKYSNGGQPTREMQMKIQEETQALYQKEGFSPMSGGCAPLLIQFPIMIGLYGVVYTPLSKVLNISTDLVNKAVTALNVTPVETGRGNAMNRVEIQLLSDINANNMPDFLAPYADDILRLKEQFMLFGKLDLTQIPQWKEPSILWLIPALVLVLGLATSLIMFQKQKQTNPEMAKNPSMGCMTFMSPLMSVWFTFLFPAGVGVYWIMSSFFQLVQTILLNATHNPQKVIARSMIDETVERRSREASIIKLKEFEEKNSD
ncbi:MAG: YidC/Oxa1 family membrane protein insertase [Clostridia bacterium]|nr:YidC/Oxa1 family membrane protein insertase [Clostridia bacterium]